MMNIAKSSYGGRLREGLGRYMEVYNSCDPQAFLDEVQVELERRVKESVKYQ
ncbi:MAG: hypothetical protein ACLRMZ_13820 [Blautia marasmi]